MLLNVNRRPMVLERSEAVHSGLTSYAGLAAAFAMVYALFAIPAFAMGLPDWRMVLANCALAGILALLSAIDWKTFRLPDFLTLPLLGLGFAVSWLIVPDTVGPNAMAAAVGGGALFLVAESYRNIRGVDALGFGDVKLFAAAGAWVGVGGLASVLLIACATALAWVATEILRGRALGGRSAIPFGPFIAFGIWIVWLYGPLA